MSVYDCNCNLQCNETLKAASYWSELLCRNVTKKITQQLQEGNNYLFNILVEFIVCT